MTDARYIHEELKYNSVSVSRHVIVTLCIPVLNRITINLGPIKLPTQPYSWNLHGFISFFSV